MAWDISASVIDRIEAMVRGVYDHELVKLAAVLGVSLEYLVADEEPARLETDREGLVTRVNQEFTRLCGHTLAELRGKRPGEILQGALTDRREARKLRKAISERRAGEATLVNYHASGAPYIVRVRIDPIVRDGRVTGFSGTARKISM